MQTFVAVAYRLVVRNWVVAASAEAAHRRDVQDIRARRDALLAGHLLQAQRVEVRVVPAGAHARHAAPGRGDRNPIAARADGRAVHLREDCILIEGQ